MPRRARAKGVLKLPEPQQTTAAKLAMTVAKQGTSEQTARFARLESQPADLSACHETRRVVAREARKAVAADGSPTKPLGRAGFRGPLRLNGAAGSHPKGTANVGRVKHLLDKATS